MKKYILTSILLSTFFFTACGGVSKNPIETLNNLNQFNNKAAIFILKGVSKNVCESNLFRDPLSEALTGLITKERPNSASCNDYGRKNNRKNCHQEKYLITPGNLACVIGYDSVLNNTENKNILDSLIIGTIISIFIKISE